MGYTTDFKGQFKFNQPLDDSTYNLLKGLSETRRMKRDADKLPYVREDITGLTDWGVEGEFYFSPDTKDFGQEKEKSIIDFPVVKRDKYRRKSF